jgi:hypothetical protein
MRNLTARPFFSFLFRTRENPPHATVDKTAASLSGFAKTEFHEP